MAKVKNISNIIVRNFSLAYESMCAKGAETNRVRIHTNDRIQSLFEMGRRKQPISLSFWLGMRLNADLQSSPSFSGLFDKDDILLQLLGTAVLVFGGVGPWASQVEEAEACLQGKGLFDVGSRAAAVVVVVSSRSVVQIPLCTFGSIACREEAGQSQTCVSNTSPAGLIQLTGDFRLAS